MSLSAPASLSVLLAAGLAGGAMADEFAPGRPGDFTLTAPAIDEPAAASPWYVRLDGGGSYIASGTAHLGPVTRGYGGGPGWSLGAGIGYRFLPQLRMDATVDVINHSRLSETAIMGNVYLDVGTFGRMTPYVGLGVGMGQITINESAPIAAIALGLQRTDWQMAWSFMAGNAWALTPSLTFNFGYRYLNLGSPAFDIVGRPIDLNLSGVQEHQFRLGLRYAFP